MKDNLEFKKDDIMKYLIDNAMFSRAMISALRSVMTILS